MIGRRREDKKLLVSEVVVVMADPLVSGSTGEVAIKGPADHALCPHGEGQGVPTDATNQTQETGTTRR